MSAIPNHWLEGRRAVVIGEGGAAQGVAGALTVGGAATVLIAARAGAEGFNDAEAQLGGPADIMVHGGSVVPPVDALAFGRDVAWRERLADALDRRFLCTTEFARRIIARAGTGSVVFLVPTESGAVAAAAEGALDNLVKTLAVEWARDGIRVNAIASRVVAAFDRAAPRSQAALGALTAYLASDYAAYVTGARMRIDEG